MSTIAIRYFSLDETSYVKNLSTEEITSFIHRKDITRPWERVASMFEILHNEDYVKIFMNINNYRDITSDTLDKLIDCFKQYFSTVKKENYGWYTIEKKYALSENFNSLNGGKSFHVVFQDYKLKLFDLRNLMKGFIKQHPEFENIVDLKIYSDGSAFRLPFQHAICLNNSEFSSEELRNKSAETWFKWLGMYGNNYHYIACNQDKTTVDLNCFIVKDTESCELFQMDDTEDICELLSQINNLAISIIAREPEPFQEMSSSEVDSKIKVRLLATDFSDVKLPQSLHDLQEKLDKHFMKNNTYNNFEMNGKVLSNYKVLKFVELFLSTDIE